MHAKFIESDFCLVTADNPDRVLKKSDDFKAHQLQYGKLISIK